MEQELAHVVCDVLETWEEQPRELVVSSFSRCAIAVLRSRLPHIACGFLVWDIPADWEQFMARHQCASLHLGWQGPASPRHRIRQCAQRVACYAYTINRVEDARELLSLGVRGVFSDCPHEVAAGLAQGQTPSPDEHQNTSSAAVLHRLGPRQGRCLDPPCCL